MPEIHVRERVLGPYPAFDDREDAGRALHEFLKCEPRENAFVLALPRGGVPIGERLAAALRAPLDLALVRKLPIRSSPEMGFGAVAIDGSRILNPAVVRMYAITQPEIESITQAVLEEVRRRARAYLGHDRPPPVKGRDLYIVDDGLATGYSMIAAAKMVHNLEPRSLTLCVPVSPETPCRLFSHILTRSSS